MTDHLRPHTVRFPPALERRLTRFRQAHPAVRALRLTPNQAITWLVESALERFEDAPTTQPQTEGS